MRMFVYLWSRLSNTPLPSSASPVGDRELEEFAHVRVEDLEVDATLGMGGFGRVELVGEKSFQLTFVYYSMILFLYFYESYIV